MRYLARIACIAWVLPNTLLGMAVGTLGLLTGGGLQYRRGALEFYGGAVRWILRLGPPGGFASAMTLGHSILGQDQNCLDLCRDHEHVHVRQYERWGPLFLPAYLLCSLWLRVRGRRAYRDNPFERQAYHETGG